MPIDFDAMKKKQAKSTYPRRGKPPLIKKTDVKETPTPQAKDYVTQTPDDIEAKRRLVKQLFDENTDLPLEEMLMEHLKTSPIKEGKTMGKTVSPLKGIREGLEDMLNIQQLKDLVMGFQTMKKNGNGNKDNNQQNNNNNNSNLSTLLPLLMKMQGGNGQIDPMTMMMMANSMGGNNNNGNNDLGQLFSMISIANMFNQNNNQNNNGNANNQNNLNQPNVNADIIKAIYGELQKVMNKQNQQSQKQAIDPLTLVMMQSINNSNKNQGIKSDNTVEVLLDKFSGMMQNNQAQQMNVIMQQNNDKWERSMEMIASAFNREKPDERFMNTFKMFREITGDQRQKSDNELSFDLKKQELILKEQSRQDMLNREERQTQREDAKSGRILDIGGVVLDKVIGNGLGNLVGDLMSAKKGSDKTKKRRGRAEIPQDDDFDPSLLDDL